MNLRSPHKKPQSPTLKNTALGSKDPSFFQSTGSPPSTPRHPFAKYYKALGVEPTDELTKIRSAYLRLAKENNPSIDSNKARFMEITEAYQIIKSQIQAQLTGTCNVYSRLGRIFDKVFDIAESTSLPASSTLVSNTEEESISPCRIQIKRV